MKNFYYLITGIVFALGLSLSGMIDAQKVISFLNFGSSEWDPALLFVLGSAAPVYLVFFWFLKRRGQSFSGAPFVAPKHKPIDRRLILGSAIFGLGWGLAGVCPGPALTHLGFLDVPFAIFLVSMFIGFEVEKRFS
jgi:uncharacterized membrane protein YedE/YeeE